MEYRHTLVLLLFQLMAEPSNCWIRLLSSAHPQPYPEDEQSYSLEFLDVVPEPSDLLSYVHDPSPQVAYIHQLSSALLRVTKDLLSYQPRSRDPQQKHIGTAQKLASLQTLRQGDVEGFLRNQGIVMPSPHAVTCPPASQFYRSMDGSCNNLNNPCWGKAEEPYQRWLPPDYSDGVDEPRRRPGGFELPSPRQIFQWVSNQFEQTLQTTYPHLNNLLVVWGQLVAHDILLTPSVTVKTWNGQEFRDQKPKCCNTTSLHPECMPIVMNYQDPYYPTGHCMDISRSSAYTYSPTSCYSLSLGRTREQINQLTSFLDASLVYGSSEEGMRQLREHNGKGAKLIMESSSYWSYPVRKNHTSCKAARVSCDNRCFLAGEGRANENPALGSLHVLLAREHNRLVNALRSKGWDEETLFHVVRKIVGAMLQHITHKEYLPVVLGPSMMDYMKLTVPTPDYKYDTALDPTVYNAFATAAFRFGHSMLSSRQKRPKRRLLGSPLLSQDLFSMDEFCTPGRDPVAYLLSGQAEQNAQRVDCLFSKEITYHLFAKEAGGMGLDLFSINVQRGRDHGIPSYNRWREACGLRKAMDYPDLRGALPDYIVERLKSVYGPGNVDDIDLFVGGIAENPFNDGILGPTFACIIAHQFKNLKYGDRFWYENLENPGALTPAQITTIQRTTLSSLLCRNSDLRSFQWEAFVMESQNNPKIPCEQILQNSELDLNLWR